MDFSIVKLFPDNLVKALCDTLLHSLWQGLILAAVTGLIIVFTRKSAAAKRYNLLVAALALFAAGTILTFVIAINHAPVNSPSSVAHSQGAQLNTQPVFKYNTPVTHKTTFTENAIGYFNKNAATVVLIWFMIVCARCLQLATGLQGIYYLRRKNIFKVDTAWENRVQELAQNLGIWRMVNIVESGVAKVPMVVGHLKPLILIPVGLLIAVPAEEIEAILIHELAHIRRSDYLVNLLQSLMEIVFFFNPAVLWISALIKTERENCCDDIAVAQSSNKVNYIKALVSCQEYNISSSAPAYAMALKNNKNHLKDRVTRIISNNNHSLNRLEKSLLAICLVTAGLFTAAFTNAEKINKLVTNTAKAVMHTVSTSKKTAINDKQDVRPVAVKTDTTTKGKLRIYRNDEFGNSTIFEGPNYEYTTRICKENGILYQLNYKNNALASMQVNGKTIPPNKIGTYQPVINQILNKFKTNDASSNATVPGSTENAANDGSKDNKQGLAALDSITQKLKTNNQPLNGSLGKLNAQSNLNLKRDQAIADSVNQQYKSSSQEYKKGALNGAWTKPVAPYQPKSAYGNPVKPYEPKAPYNPNSPDYKPYSKVNDDERRNKIITEMISDGIIQSKDNLSFKISSSEFIVNGKKQPDEVYQKYRAKYVKIVGNGEWSWLYNYDTDAKRESNTVVDKSNN
ncbi:M56 family metallopeptidase [Mucilaginibacter sp. OK098]|uniref:M56 family metallopeptidase n=1 Tax=Mucilaginibacter sp. OK098 TaxID=1855297 RepID=UPI0009154EC3|nr:M56 family metallopeptidase [Mucilaginibacter sp. OK098]SHM91714.1 Signal transducer regulating beta-lactamase production, contains metallopeptidase domain [Mucilaginibacter sp. OK098]